MPSSEIVRKALGAIKRAADYRYFFEHLSSPEWIEPLLEAGLFRDPPEPIREGDYVRYPAWPESQYLARMAARDPEKVLRVIMAVPETRNFRVHEDFIDAALAMLPDVAARLLPMALKWAEAPDQLVLPEKLGQLIAHLARGDQVVAALQLAKELLAVQPDPRHGQANEKLPGYQPGPEPRARFDERTYADVLDEVTPSLISAGGLEAFRLLSDLLEQALRYSQRPGHDAFPEDYSWVWRPTIQEVGRGYRDKLMNALVSAVRDSTEHLAATDKTIFPQLVNLLEGRGWHVFRRIALHLLHVQPAAAPGLIAERLLDRSLLEVSWCAAEYNQLLSEQFVSLGREFQVRWLALIEGGPASALEQEIVGAEVSPEALEEVRTAWRRRHLAPVVDLLPVDWRAAHGDWLENLLPQTEFARPLVSAEWVGPTSPKSAADLQGMTVEEVVEFLHSWQPTGEWKSPSREGLARELTKAITAEPTRFASASWEGLPAVYMEAVLSGFEDAAKEDRSFPWARVLDLCHWVLHRSHALFQPGEASSEEQEWMGTRKRIADLLSQGFVARSSEVPFELRAPVWDILRPLTDEADPTPQYEARYGGTNMDPATLAINTTRGAALHATIRYALWVRRYLEALPNGEARTERGFDEMPEVREVLDLHLDLAHDASLAIRSVYGQYFPWLVLLDRTWTVSAIPRIFLRDPSLQMYRDVAWDTYVVFCRPYHDVVDVLPDEYAWAITRIGSSRGERPRFGDPEASLAEHLMSQYWNRGIGLEQPDGLVVRFFERAIPAIREHAIEYLGRSLYNAEEKVEPAVLDRLKRLWNWRLEVAGKAPARSPHTDELSAFGWWFASGQFEDSWAIAQLKQVLILIRSIEPDSFVIDRLTVLAPAMPREAIDCLALIAQGDERGWKLYTRRDKTRAILETAIRTSDPVAREKAVNLIHLLGAKGEDSYRDLLT